MGFSVYQKIVIIGVGTIGRTILKSLAREGHTITIIDENKDRIESLIEQYDVYGVTGNGACMDIQKEAGMEEADLAVALTGSDELNVFACLVAKKIGVKNTIARVRKPEYRAQILDMKDELGISMIVNPEKDTANEIFYLINLPSIAKIDHFAKGRVSLVEIVVRDGCTLIGETLISLGKKLHTKVLVCAVQRGDAVESGETLLSGVVEPVCGLAAVVFAAVAMPAMPWLLSFAAGAMLYVVAQELVPQARGWGGTCGYMMGFILMMVMDVALG